ncbi:nuclear transport factor 2 family protein [Nonomuraea muscovyensis]|jgi:predicted SnoaL-like aldol condensation-catalyzing enzyme|uniref:Putative SnoaL-like aldol condensation-catalyzing enzyme n=1 Tax=Nonomuraea muscovyensis TaxID=1124761 RepID=A0A7X0F280_9ACTN|nr:nuclear transport factor 2 family protein [Nonomuraea muscovyensis]MBB6350060.1 putative SnoaL-like aldol condensation-catalyzing enzyme [Nonomuraea muscovyensis]
MSESNKAARNKELVVHGFTEFAAGNIDVLRTVLHEDFIEHSPGNPSGREAFIAFVAKAPVARARLDLKRVVADDEHVVMHYHMATDDDPRGVAVVDIWRLVDGQIVEHWDVVQPVPETARVPHGMF